LPASLKMFKALMAFFLRKSSEKIAVRNSLHSLHGNVILMFYGKETVGPISVLYFESIKIVKLFPI